MISRRKAREIALKVLYEVDIAHTPASSALRQSLDENDLAPAQAEYAKRLVEGVRADIAQIDDLLSRRITDYSFDRVAPVDRNVMRIATFELFNEPDIPPAVSINEAIEIAKKYSTPESGKFVNGVLGKILDESPKANWTRSEQTEPEDSPEPEVVPEAEVEVLDQESDEAKRLARIGGWVLRSEEPKV